MPRSRSPVGLGEDLKRGMAIDAEKPVAARHQDRDGRGFGAGNRKKSISARPRWELDEVVHNSISVR